MPPWGRRLALGGGSFVVAFVVDVATEQRWSMVLGGAATTFSLSLLLLGGLQRSLPLLLYTAVWIVGNAGRAVADDVQLAVLDADLVADLERGGFGGPLPTATLQTWLFDPMHLRPYDAGLTAIHLSFFVTPMLTATILFARVRAVFWRYLIATIGCFAIGLVGFALLPTAPPWSLADERAGGDVARVAGDVLAALGLTAMEGGGSAAGGYVFEPNHLASMPSIHVAAVALVACAVWSSRTRRAFAFLAGLYWLLMAVAVVYLGEHYVLDVLAGSAVAVGSWWAAGRFLERRGADQR